MQAVIQSQAIKFASVVAQQKSIQSKPASPAAAEKKLGTRFLGFLLIALSGLPV